MSTTQGGGNIVADGLVLYLDSANTKSYVSGSTVWNDLSRSILNGTLTNGPTFNTGNGGSIVFDGTNNFIQLGVTPKLQFTNSDPYSISSWVYWTPVGSNFNTLLCYGDVAGVAPAFGDEGYYLTLDNNVLRSQSFLFDYFDGVTFKGIQGNAGVVPINSWFNIVGTSTSNNANGLKIYINGVLSSYTIRSLGPPASINYANSVFNVGARDVTTFFNGRIANTMVYNKELSSTEVLQNYNVTKSRFGL
jgi:hypothetical protein